MFKSRFDVSGDVSFGFLEHNFVAVWHLVGEPSCEIFRRWVEGKEIVQEMVIQLVLNFSLYVAEIYHHPVRVEGFRAA